MVPTAPPARTVNSVNSHNWVPCCILGYYWDKIGIMEKKMETTM